MNQTIKAKHSSSGEYLTRRLTIYEKMNIKDVTQEIKNHMQRKNVTQKMLAERTGISEATISRLMRADDQNPLNQMYEKLLLISMALDIGEEGFFELLKKLYPNHMRGLRNGMRPMFVYEDLDDGI